MPKWSQILLAVATISAGCWGQMTVTRLRQHLLKGYDRKTRPVIYANSTIPVRIGLSPSYIVDMDEVQGILRLETWVEMYWSDQHLQWNPAEFDGLESVTFSKDEIWNPDINLNNSWPFSRLDQQKSTPLLVTSDGNVLYAPAYTLHPYCPLDQAKDFPWDSHTCSLFFDSMTYITSLEMTSTGVSLFMFHNDNRNWTLTTATAEVIYRNQSFNREPQPVLQVRLELQRRGTRRRWARWAAGWASVVLAGLGPFLPGHSRMFPAGASVIIGLAVEIYVGLMGEIYMTEALTLARPSILLLSIMFLIHLAATVMRHKSGDPLPTWIENLVPGSMDRPPRAKLGFLLDCGIIVGLLPFLIFHTARVL